MFKVSSLSFILHSSLTTSYFFYYILRYYILLISPGNNFGVEKCIMDELSRDLQDIGWMPWFASSGLSQFTDSAI